VGKDRAFLVLAPESFMLTLMPPSTFPVPERKCSLPCFSPCYFGFLFMQLNLIAGNTK
jgi:hypothetical protein